MTEQSENNPPAAENSQTQKLDDEFILEDALPLCLKCFKPCHPLQHYCNNCGSNETINPLASYMPFVRIRFNIDMLGKLWRRILYDKDTSIMRKLFFLFLIIMAVLFQRF